MNFCNVGPSHGLQFFPNCSSVGPFHGLQSFRHRLLQRGSPTRLQVLPEDLLQHGLLSPQIHRSCQEPAPVTFLCVTCNNFCLFRQLLKCMQVTFYKPSDSHHKDEPSAVADLAYAHRYHQRFQCSDVSPAVVLN